MIRRTSPISARVRKIAPGCLTRADAAEALGISVSTLVSYCKRKEIKAPSQVAMFGTLEVGLFSAEDIAELRAYIKEVDRLRAPGQNRSSPGAPKRYTATQLRERMRLRQKRNYHSAQAKAKRGKARIHHAELATAAQVALDTMPTRQQKARERKEKRDA